MSETYNPAIDMPRTLTEWNELVDYYTEKSATEHAEAVAAVRASAEAAYANLPDSDGKPTLEEFIAQAVSGVPAAQPRSDFERQFACYYPQPAPEAEPAPTTDELFAQLRSYREVRLREYDTKISQLDRLIREHPDYAAYQLERAAWDEYATALCNLTLQEGAPWDGGGPLTPWPAKPE